MTSECFAFVYCCDHALFTFFCSFYSNTYTNKTCSEVSRISLTKLYKMEHKFLLGVNLQLYVDKQTYKSWLNLLREELLGVNRTRVVRHSSFIIGGEHRITLYTYASTSMSSIKTSNCTEILRTSRTSQVQPGRDDESDMRILSPQPCM